MRVFILCLFFFTVTLALQVPVETKHEIQTSDTNQGYLCQACVLGVNLIRGYIHQPDEVLIKILVDSCDALPEYFIEPCKLSMRTFGKELIAIVREYINEDSRQICLRFGACAAKQVVPFTPKKTPLCQPCQAVAVAAKEYFGKLSDKEIKDFLYKGCLYFAEDLQPLCRTILGFTSDGMVSGLRTFLRNEPKVMCQTLGVCQ